MKVLDWEKHVEAAKDNPERKGDPRAFVDNEWQHRRIAIICQRCGENASTRASEAYYAYWCDACSDNVENGERINLEEVS